MVRMIRNAKCNGVLFTHYHGNHIGLMGKIPGRDLQGNLIRLGLGKISKYILQNIHKTVLKALEVTPKEQLENEDMLKLLRNEERWENLCDGEVFWIGDFKITPVRVDHSTYDAFLFIIDAEGKCLIHIGDFRTHGRLGKDLFSHISKHLKGKRMEYFTQEDSLLICSMWNIMKINLMEYHHEELPTDVFSQIRSSEVRDFCGMKLILICLIKSSSSFTVIYQIIRKWLC